MALLLLLQCPSMTKFHALMGWSFLGISVVGLQILNVLTDDRSTGHSESHCSKFTQGDDLPRSYPRLHQLSALSLLGTVFDESERPDSKRGEISGLSKSPFHCLIHHISDWYYFITN